MKNFVEICSCINFEKKKQIKFSATVYKVFVLVWKRRWLSQMKTANEILCFWNFASFVEILMNEMKNLVEMRWWCFFSGVRRVKKPMKWNDMKFMRRKCLFYDITQDTPKVGERGKSNESNKNVLCRRNIKQICISLNFVFLLLKNSPFFFSKTTSPISCGKR